MADSVTTASATSPGRAPYVGLSYYTEADAEWFFGREDDTQTIIGNLRAARLTVLYARSGAGKSSLLRAGVAHQLIERARRQLAVRGSPGYVPVVFSGWKDDPVDDLVEAIESAIEPFLSPGERTPLPRTLDAATAAAARATDAELLIILDQFEEYLLYHAQDATHTPFADELAACVTDRDLRANFLIAIRDDAYASLGDLFAGSIPNVYSNYLQLENLDRDAAREAIVGPIEHFNELHPDEPPIEIERGLLETVLTEVTAEQQPGAGSAQDRHEGNGARAAREEIETPYLQLVMARLWAREREHGSRVLRLATLQELGGAQEIVRTHLDGELDALSKQDYATALDLFHYLVTPSGTKIAFAASDLAELVEKPYDPVEKLLARLAGEDTRILRHVPPPAGRTAPSDRYELYHDVLAPAIVDWRRRALEQRKRAEEKRERERLEREKREADERAQAEAGRRRAFQRLAIGAIGLLLVAVLLGILAWLSRKSAVANLKAAQANELVASSERALPGDPELSALLALRALHLKYSPPAEAALRQALPLLQETRAPIRASTPVDSAVFSPAGSEILSSYEGGAATIRNAASGALLKLINGHDGAAEDAAFSPDGSKVIVAYKGGTAIVWDLTSGARRILPVHEGPVYKAAFSPDGSKVVTASKGGNAVIWDVASGKPLQVLRAGARDGAANSAVFSPDGAEVLTADEAGTAILWDWRDGAQLHVLTGHVGNVESAAFNRTGTEVVTAGEDGTTRIWDAASGLPEAVLGEPGGAVLEAAFSPDGKEVVSAGQDRTATVWDLASRNRIMSLSGDEGPVREASFSPDGRELVTAGQDGTIRTWDSSPRELLALLRGDQGQILGAGFDPSGTRLITANQNSTATVWNLRSGARVATLEGHRGPVYTAEFSPNGKLALTAGHDGTARIWQLGARAPATVLPSDGGHLDSAAFNVAGTEIVTSSSLGVTRIWPAAGGRPLHVLRGSSGREEDASFNRAGTEVVTANEDGTATIWDPADGKKTQLRASDAPLLTAVFSPAGNEILTAGNDGSARLWSVPGGKRLLTLSPLGGPIYSAAFSPDGRTVATVSEDGELRLWDAATGEQLASLDGHRGVVLSAAFNGSGSEIATTDEDGTAEVWSTELAVSRRALQRLAASRVTRTLNAEQRKVYPSG